MSTNTIYTKKTCKKCRIDHNKSGEFCSRSCANSRSHSKETKSKISNTLKSDNTKARDTLILVNCTICKSEFYKKKYSKKHLCSKNCYSLNLKNKAGGIRENSGRSKSGYYHGIYCGSTYELVYVMYRIANKLPVNRYDGFIAYGNNKKYFPDFIEEKCIIEIKGFETENVIEKTNACISQGYDIKVLYKKDIQYMFDWYNSVYGSQKIHEHYDSYKPAYTYICDYCNTAYSTDNKKDGINYCSRKCSGYGVKLYEREMS